MTLVWMVAIGNCVVIFVFSKVVFMFREKIYIPLTLSLFRPHIKHSLIYDDSLEVTQKKNKFYLHNIIMFRVECASFALHVHF